MNYSNLTISYQKGRKGTIIGSILEMPQIVVRGANQVEVRTKILQALAHQQKESLVTDK